jgi:hypothetical protein
MCGQDLNHMNGKMYECFPGTGHCLKLRGIKMHKLIYYGKPYSEQMKELFAGCTGTSNIYQTVKPVKCTGQVKPLTNRQRRLIDEISIGRDGWRPFTAQGMRQ